MRSFFSALLIIAVILLLAACSAEPEKTLPGTETAGTLPEAGPGSDIFADRTEAAGSPETSADSAEKDPAGTTGSPAAPEESTAAPGTVPDEGVPNWVSGVQVNFRKTPGTDGEIISRLSKGTEIEKLAEEGDWLLVRYEGMTGYIHRDYASDTLPEPETDEVRIIVKKSERKLELWQHGTLTGAYSVGLGFSPVGHKQAEGDGKTPEGEYYVCMKNSRSKYHLSLGVSYPNKADAAAALEAGRITQAVYDRIAAANDWRERPDWYTPLGGEIMIHGGGGNRDWTAGCMAVGDEVVDILFRTCPVGTRITILP